MANHFMKKEKMEQSVLSEDEFPIPSKSEAGARKGRENFLPVPSNEELYERSIKWANFMKRCENKLHDSEDMSVFVSNLGTDLQDDDSDESSNESVDVDQFENTDQSDNSQVDEALLEQTMAVIKSRKNKMYESGIDNILDSFNAQEITEKVGLWLTDPNCSFRNNNNTIVDKKNLRESLSDSDDSFQSVDTVKYILSNRKRTTTNVATMTIKQYCISKNSRIELKTKYNTYLSGNDGDNLYDVFFNKNNPIMNPFRHGLRTMSEKDYPKSQKIYGEKLRRCYSSSPSRRGGVLTEKVDFYQYKQNLGTRTGRRPLKRLKRSSDHRRAKLFTMSSSSSSSEEEVPFIPRKKAKLETPANKALSNDLSINSDISFHPENVLNSTSLKSFIAASSKPQAIPTRSNQVAHSKLQLRSNNLKIDDDSDVFVIGETSGETKETGGNKKKSAPTKNVRKRKTKMSNRQPLKNPSVSIIVEEESNDKSMEHKSVKNEKIKKFTDKIEMRKKIRLRSTSNSSYATANSDIDIEYNKFDKPSKSGEPLSIQSREMTEHVSSSSIKKSIPLEIKETPSKRGRKKDGQSVLCNCDLSSCSCAVAVTIPAMEEIKANTNSVTKSSGNSSKISTPSKLDNSDKRSSTKPRSEPKVPKKIANLITPAKKIFNLRSSTSFSDEQSSSKTCSESKVPRKKSKLTTPARKIFNLPSSTSFSNEQSSSKPCSESKVPRKIANLITPVKKISNLRSSPIPTRSKTNIANISQSCSKLSTQSFQNRYQQSPFASESNSSYISSTFFKTDTNVTIYDPDQAELLSDNIVNGRINISAKLLADAIGTAKAESFLKDNPNSILNFDATSHIIFRMPDKDSNSDSCSDDSDDEDLLDTLDKAGKIIEIAKK